MLVTAVVVGLRDRPQIRQTKNRRSGPCSGSLTDGWNAHDPDRMAAIYAEDIDHINVFGEWRRGKAAVAATSPDSCRAVASQPEEEDNRKDPLPDVRTSPSCRCRPCRVLTMSQPAPRWGVRGMQKQHGGWAGGELHQRRTARAAARQVGDCRIETWVSAGSIRRLLVENDRDSIGSEPALTHPSSPMRTAGSLSIEPFGPSRWRLRRTRGTAMGVELYQAEAAFLDGWPGSSVQQNYRLQVPTAWRTPQQR